MGDLLLEISAGTGRNQEMGRTDTLTESTAGVGSKCPRPTEGSTQALGTPETSSIAYRWVLLRNNATALEAKSQKLGALWIQRAVARLRCHLWRLVKIWTCTPGTGKHRNTKAKNLNRRAGLVAKISQISVPRRRLGIWQELFPN